MQRGFALSGLFWQGLQAAMRQSRGGWCSFATVVWLHLAGNHCWM